MAQRRAVANRGHPRRLMLGDVAKQRVQGHWQTGGSVFDAQCQVTWQRRAVGDQGRPQHSTLGDVAKWRVRGQ